MEQQNMNSVLKQYETLSRTLFIKEFGQCFFMHSNNNSSMEISKAATFTNLKCRVYSRKYSEDTRFHGQCTNLSQAAWCSTKYTVVVLNLS